MSWHRIQLKGKTQHRMGQLVPGNHYLAQEVLASGGNELSAGHGEYGQQFNDFNSITVCFRDTMQ
jgi:hypothetical protein